MATKTTEQTQKTESKAPSFDFSGWTAGFEQNLELLERMQDDGIERIRDQVTSSSKMMIDSLDYAHRLGKEWRKLAFDATRTTAEAAKRS